MSLVHGYTINSGLGKLFLKLFLPFYN